MRHGFPSLNPVTPTIIGCRLRKLNARFNQVAVRPLDRRAKCFPHQILSSGMAWRRPPRNNRTHRGGTRFRARRKRIDDGVETMMSDISRCVATALLLAGFTAAARAQAEVTFPPSLPGGVEFVSDMSREMLKPGATLREGVAIAATPPTVDFYYYPGQTYAAKLWSAWGESLAVAGKCYSAIGDHDGPRGNAFMYEYDVQSKKLRLVVDLNQTLRVPEGQYTPGKIHSRIDRGSDGWLYFSTHRGSTRVTTPENGFRGGWIVRYHPELKKSEIVVHAPLPEQTLPTSTLDPDRMIYYAGTQDGANEKEPQFLAYDLKKRRVLFQADRGPARYAIFARSTGRVYFHAEKGDRSGKARALVRFDPAAPDRLTPTKAMLGMRAATVETPAGKVYTIDADHLWEFDTKTETARRLGDAAVGEKDYTTSLDLDRKTNRYVYYIPGAHGGAENDGSPLVQYDVRTNRRKVIAFLSPYYHRKYDYTPSGAYGVAVSPDGGRVYITWNGARGADGSRKRVRWNTCAFMVVHIPASERKP
jgi:hypothetical protein